MRFTKDQYEGLRREIVELAKRYYSEKGHMPPAEEVVQRFGVSFSFAYTCLRLASWELTHPASESNPKASGGGER